MGAIEEFRQQAAAAPIVKPDAPAEPDDREDSIPAPERLDLRDLPEPAPELIGGVLRVGDVMIVSGPSKAGKTWLLMELAVAVATGGQWLGMQCRQGRVLYIDGEMKRLSALHRFAKVARAMGADPDAVHEGIARLGLRGHTDDLQRLVPEIASRAKGGNYSLVIIDPSYKVMRGDENAAGDVGRFCDAIDRLSETLGCSVVFAHHHSKGAKGDVAAVDRMSGSGVFARYPDAVLDLIELVPSDEDRPLPERTTAWHVSFVLRDFPSRAPLNILFDCSDGKPRHMMDSDGRLDGLQPMTASRKGGLARARQTKANNVKKERDICRILCEMEHDYPDGKIPAREAREQCGYDGNRRSFNERLDACGGWRRECVNGNQSFIMRC